MNEYEAIKAAKKISIRDGFAVVAQCIHEPTHFEVMNNEPEESAYHCLDYQTSATLYNGEFDLGCDIEKSEIINKFDLFFEDMIKGLTMGQVRKLCSVYDSLEIQLEAGHITEAQAIEALKAFEV